MCSSSSFVFAKWEIVDGKQWNTWLHCTALYFSIPNIICLCAGDLLILCWVGGQLNVFHGERCDKECCHLLASPVPWDVGRKQGQGKFQQCLSCCEDAGRKLTTTKYTVDTFMNVRVYCFDIETTRYHNILEFNQNYVFLSFFSVNFFNVSELHFSVVLGEWGSCWGGYCLSARFGLAHPTVGGSRSRGTDNLYLLIFLNLN